MRKLAFDLGSKSLGIAVSDETNIIAIGLENFVFKDYDLDAITNKINSLLKQYEVDLIIFGLPTFASGELVENAKWIL
ncbi:MAG: Holliday junction resolvase RuvX, partial [Mycoplasma sp.]|nr:Holliday junction resolvase RuvX [Mycoplasma sp.]